MPPSPTIDWTAWTARLAVVLYAAAILVRLRGPSGSIARRWPSVERTLWIAGWLILVVHVLCAFHFRHHWSFAEAQEHTVRQTRDVIGFGFRGGLAINFLFVVWWGLDGVLRCLTPPPRWSQSHSYRFATHIFLAFIVLNATVVFGPAFWKPTGALWMLLALASLWRRNVGRAPESDRPGR